MKSEKTIVVVESLGELKIFNAKELGGSYSLDLLKGIDFINEHERVSEIVSDHEGNFNGGTLDDADKLLIEQKKRITKKIAEEINNIVKSEKPEQLFLALAKESSDKLMDDLTQDTKAILTKVIYKNLVNTDKNKILSHFA